VFFQGRLCSVKAKIKDIKTGAICRPDSGPDSAGSSGKSTKDTRNTNNRKSMNSSNRWASVRLLWRGLLMGVCASLYAQDPGGNQAGAKSNGVESEQKTVSAVVRRGGVQSQVKAFFKELEQQDGVKDEGGRQQKIPEEGGDFFVAVGVAEISAHRSSKDWADFTGRCL